jgi:hypothetical protein
MDKFVELKKFSKFGVHWNIIYWDILNIFPDWEHYIFKAGVTRKM